MVRNRNNILVKEFVINLQKMKQLNPITEGWGLIQPGITGLTYFILSQNLSTK